MLKHFASIFLVIAVLYSSSVVCALTVPKELIHTDEDKINRDENKLTEKHDVTNDEAIYTLQPDQKHTNKSEPDIDENKEIQNSIGEELAKRALFAAIIINSAKEPIRTKLSEKLDDAAINQHWNSLDEFALYCVKQKVIEDFHFIGIELSESDLNFSASDVNLSFK